MNNQSLVEIKLKASEFMQQYEKQQTEREYQKQRLKQNIMLDILSNRNKTQSSVSNRQSKIQETSLTRQEMQKKAGNRKENGPYSEYRDKKNGNEQLGNRSHSLSMNENQAQNLVAEITFKPQKNSSNLMKKSYKYQEPEITQSHYQQPEDEEQFQNQQEDEEDHLRDQQMTFRNPDSKKNDYIEVSRRSDIANSEKFKFLEPKVKPQSEDESYESSGYAQMYRQKLNKSKDPEESEVKTDREGDEQENEELEEQIENHRGVFLTVEENQSMELTQEIPQKNCAFDIMMEKSEPIDNMEELRKKKIEQMDKKRQMRLSEHRKSEQKKSESSNPRASNYSRKSQTKISEDPEPSPKYSYQRPKIAQQEKVTNLSANIPQQPYYNYNNPSNASIKRSYNYMPQHQPENYSHQAIRTPPTITSEMRGNKSRNKNTIFKQSPRRAEKSSSKYSQEPKIQPKERKNTFVKQSNRKLMINAVTHVCLPGELNRKDREKLTEVIENDPAQFFVFLFKEYSRKVIKAIYTLDHSQTVLQKIYGEKSPQEIVSENVKTFYRFDSGSRQFKKLDGCKSFSLVVHAIDLR